jgi:hypothetical protein
MNLKLQNIEDISIQSLEPNDGLRKTIGNALAARYSEILRDKTLELRVILQANKLIQERMEGFYFCLR